MNLLSENDIKVKEKVEAEVVRFGEMGIRTLAVAKMDLMDGKNEWKMIGLLTFLDPPRPDTKQTIVDANKYGMLEDRTEFLLSFFLRFHLLLYLPFFRCQREDGDRRSLAYCEANCTDSQHGHKNIHIREPSNVGS
jgi:hypothetical protein